jgi:phage terminase small subunit
MRGRPRLPDDEKKKRGTFKPSRSTGDEIQDIVILDAGDPLIPLGKYGMEMWRTVTQTMISYRTLAEIDLSMIAMLCAEYDTYIETLSSGNIEITDTGQSVPSGYFKVRKECLQNILKLSHALQISNIVRSKIRQPDTDKKSNDPAAKFFKM